MKKKQLGKKPVAKIKKAKPKKKTSNPLFKSVAPKPMLATVVAPEAPLETRAPLEHLRVLKDGLSFDQNSYEFDSGFRPMQGVRPMEAHTIPEMIHCLTQDKSLDIDARVMCSDGRMRHIEGRENFLGFVEKSEQKWKKMPLKERASHMKRLKENDYFATNVDNPYSGGSVNSDDFTPLLGGPFFKQLYINDYLRMNAACFFAFHHDPVAKATIGIMRDFVLGRGFSVQSADPAAQIAWDAFMEVNGGQQFWAEHFVETEVYGESLIWKLPKNEAFIAWQRLPNQKPPTVLIPRVRLVDPSNIWEIITYPEDIKQVIAYQWLAPTQFQTYTAPGVPSLKYIFTQIPADQMIHVKTNAVSNEKRGRSELFASLGYLKRLRDSVNYSIVAMQKNSAWSIDTTIDGNQADINSYAAAQAALGTLPPAGSEFIHSKKVERKYLGSTSSSGNLGTAFDWCLSMIAMGSRVPVSYYGTHLSGGQTRASALVATEPVAKMFESKRLRLEGTIKELHRWLTGTDCEVIWPELITQDRSAKLRDIILLDQQGYITGERAATMSAREMSITGYDYKKEKAELSAEAPAPQDLAAPLTTPGKVPGQQGPPQPKDQKSSAFNGQDRNQVKKNDQRL